VIAFSARSLGKNIGVRNFFESAPRNLAARALDPPAARGGVSSWLFSLQLNGWQRGPTSCLEKNGVTPDSSDAQGVSRQGEKLLRKALCPEARCGTRATPEAESNTRRLS
jgi:hypothetical protein